MEIEPINYSVIKKYLILFKVDFEKAYDIIEWEYLEAAMLKIRFHFKWCKWIMEYVWVQQQLRS